MKTIIALLLSVLAICQTITADAQNKNTERLIIRTDTVVVVAPAGTAPRLPHIVWVTYSDGSGEYRQTAWTNDGRSTEEAMADLESYPPGTAYTIRGYVIGDNTTDNGYPLDAEIRVEADKYEVPESKPKAEPLPLDRVSIKGDNRLTANRDLAIKTILSWDVSQQLYNYRDTYGLPTEGYKVADGWDSPTTKLKGHGSGHYMSALAFAFASATDDAIKDSLRSRIRRMVNELRMCQERTFVWNDSLNRYWEARDFAPEEELRQMKGTWEAFDEHKKEYERYGYGYLGAIPAHHAVLIEMYRPYNNSDWVWAPYYAIHKQLAGLIDIANYIDDKDIASKALLIAKDMGLWIWNRLHYRTFVKTDGSREERRDRPGNRYEMWNMYIAGEDGGTGESLSRLSEMVDSKEDKKRLLEAASFFDSPAFFDPLSRNIDDIRTRHANQHIPKITSALRSYRGNGNDYYYNLALNFWQMVQGRYAYAMGGVGNGEMFRQPYTQMLSMNSNMTTDRKGRQIPNPTLNETCCAYNLAKLTKDLNCYDPDNAQLMDYYERVLYNQIIGSLHPEHYMTTYHYAVGLNASKPWGNRTPQESCCGGTGSESHVKYQEAAYFVSDNTLWVALYMPTTARWQQKGVTIEQDCLWPAERTKIRITEGKARFAMKLRIPYWATKGFEIKINGERIGGEVAAVSECRSDDNSLSASNLFARQLVNSSTKTNNLSTRQLVNSSTKTNNLSTESNYSSTNNLKTSFYFEIPKRRWRKGDVVEIYMPFTKHIHYGPDKFEVASLQGSKVASLQGSKDLKTSKPNNLMTSSWLGALMYGPLVMATDGISNWDEAVAVTDSRLDSITANAPTADGGTNGNLYTLSLNGRTFFPDYYADKNFTHYLRIKNTSYRSEGVKEFRSEDNSLSASNLFALSQSKGSTRQLVNSSTKTNNSSTRQLVNSSTKTNNLSTRQLVNSSTKTNNSSTKEITLAEERIKEQEAWLRMEKKVPDHAPWAPHGYARMVEEYSKVKNGGATGNISQLRSILNTMRPGNLAELEDLKPLLELMEKAKREKGKEEALEYAEMVVRYVSDGSGTLDMIKEACGRIEEASPPNPSP